MCHEIFIKFTQLTDLDIELKIIHKTMKTMGVKIKITEVHLFFDDVLT